MRSLEEIKDLYAQSRGKGYKKWGEFYIKEIIENRGVGSEEHFDFIAKMYAYSSCEQTLINASESFDFSSVNIPKLN